MKGGMIIPRKSKLRLRRAENGRLKRWSAFASLAGGFLVVTALGGLAMGEKGMTAIATVIKDPASLLSARSPGGRGEGAMYSIKGARKVAGTPVGDPGVGGPGRNSGGGAPAGGGDDGTPVPSAFAANPIPDGTVGLPGGAPGVLGPAGDGVTPVITGPGAPPTIIPPLIPGGGGSTNPPPPVTAVPEPGTWLMLIVGFFATGYALRRQKRNALLLGAEESAREPG
jgi:hypothetical protein